MEHRNSKGLLHRTDGPAVTWADGSEAWYLNGLLHRTDGPAWTEADGSEAWWVNGQRHRTDGPAWTWADGTQEWWVNGQELSEEQVLIAKKMLKNPRWDQIPRYISDQVLGPIAEQVLKRPLDYHPVDGVGASPEQSQEG